MKRLILFSIILIHSLIVSSQCEIHGRTSHDGCKAFTKAQRIQCEQALTTVAYLDSVLFVKDSELNNLQAYIERTETRFNEVVSTGIELGAQLDKETKRKKVWRKVAISAIFVGILEAMIIIFVK